MSLSLLLKISFNDIKQSKNMKLNKAIVNNYLNNSSPEDQRELLEALLGDFNNQISNLSLKVLDYSKDKALNYITESQYHLIHHHLPRNFFYTNEEIREDVKAVLQNLTEVEIEKIYSLLLEIRPMPNTSPESESYNLSLQPRQR